MIEGVAVRSVMEANALAATRGDLDRHHRNSLNALTALAATRQYRVDPRETELASYLEEAGVATDRQAPFGPYGVDILIDGTIAMEVEGSVTYPLGVARKRQRMEDLFDRGVRRMLFVWVPRHQPVDCVQLLPWVALAQNNPTAFGKYRVIRGTGKDATRPEH